MLLLDGLCVAATQSGMLTEWPKAKQLEPEPASGLKVFTIY